MGCIFDIQHYSIHDGPGIRSTVFFKGCPLNCAWCHNPESKIPNPEFMWWKDRCIGCNACAKACPNNAIGFNSMLKVDESKCKMCRNCVNACYSDALKIIGEEMSVAKVIREINKDRIFYEETAGGVTFSGGEPLLQHIFLKELLTECKHQGIHTAVETCGYADPNVILSIRGLVDLFLFDVKHMDDKLHFKYTGVSNQLILSNLRLIKGWNTIIRFPLVTGINDDITNIEALGSLVRDYGFPEIDLLPYHKAGSEKLKRLNNAVTPFLLVEQPQEEKLKEVKAVLEGYCIKVKIGG